MAWVRDSGSLNLDGSRGGHAEKWAALRALSETKPTRCAVREMKGKAVLRMTTRFLARTSGSEMMSFTERGRPKEEQI